MKMCKYTLKTRKKIKRLFDQGFKQIDIANIIGCSRFTVYYSLKMIHEPHLFDQQFPNKRKNCQDFSLENSLKLRNTSKAATKCPTTDNIEEQIKKYNNCKINDKLWNGKIKIKLGETIYSGPPSKYQEGAYCKNQNDCSSVPSQHARGLVNGESTVDSNEKASCGNKNGHLKCTSNLRNHSDVDHCVNHNVNDQSIDSLLLKQLVVSKKQLKGPDEALGSGCSSPLSEGSEAEPLVLEEDSTESCDLSSVCSTSLKCLETRKTRDIVGNSKLNSILKSDKHQGKNLTPSVQSATNNSDSKKDMVRLMQESAKCDSHNTRKNVRAPKRFCSVDDAEVDVAHKKPCPNNRSLKPSRFRRLSCRSDFSDSENSDAFPSSTGDQDKEVGKFRKTKNAELSDSDRHLNGDDFPPLNGLEKTGKGRKVNRTNSEEVEPAPSTAKVNHIESDFDKVDINLLLEISATDRKKFENKKAKIRRKTADWTLISETEQYYNEREEILRNKSKCDFTSESEGEDISSRIGKPLRPAQNKPVDSCTEKRSLNERDRKLKSVKTPKISPPKRLQDTKCTKELRHRSLNSRGKKPLYDLSILEDDLSDLFQSETVALKRGPRKKRNCPINKSPLPAHRRLTSAERFLRDNKEYYQFPETRDRLRRSLQSPVSAAEGEGSSQDKSTDHEEPRSLSLTTDRGRRISSESTKSAESCDGTSHLPDTRRRRRSSIDSDVDNIYFSFEGEPKGESWYQTYQRLVDGVPDNEYKYDEPSLRFVLPYEMPKEYFKDLYSKKFFARRKNDLTDFVRKSPRCHASTLAFFSDIFPSKRKKGKPGPKKAEEVSSDGASTPSRDSSVPVTEVNKSNDNVLAISLYINQLMHSSCQPNAPLLNLIGEDCSKLQNEGRRSHAKKRTKGKKTASTADFSKCAPQLPSKEFDNNLTLQMDNKFLLQLSSYMNEADMHPEDILSKDPSVALAESFSCGCTDDKPSDGASVCDMTDASSECLSLCSVDSNVDNSFNTSKGLRNKLLKSTYKKRRKNMTGWPKQKRRRPVAVPPSDDNDSTAGAIVRARPRVPLMWRNRGRNRMESRLITEGSMFGAGSKRGYPRRKAGVFHNDAWPVRHRSCK